MNIEEIIPVSAEKAAAESAEEPPSGEEVATAEEQPEEATDVAQPIDPVGESQPAEIPTPSGNTNGGQETAETFFTDHRELEMPPEKKPKRGFFRRWSK